jgi:hypothetical protein
MMALPFSLRSHEEGPRAFVTGWVGPWGGVHWEKGQWCRLWLLMQGGNDDRPEASTAASRARVAGPDRHDAHATVCSKAEITVRPRVSPPPVSSTGGVPYDASLATEAPAAFSLSA